MLRLLFSIICNISLNTDSQFVFPHLLDSKDSSLLLHSLSAKRKHIGNCSVWWLSTSSAIKEKKLSFLHFFQQIISISSFWITGDMHVAFLMDGASEFAKLRTFRALFTYALYVPTCLRASNYYVPACLCALNYYVPTCLKLPRA